MTRAASGDGGFDEFFESTYPRVVRALTAGLGDRAEAEDAAQEAFAKALVRWSRVRTMERPDGWVFIVASRGARRALARADRLNGSVGHASVGPRVVAAPGDEAGQGLRPPKGRTWAPRGARPVVKVRGAGGGRVSIAGVACYRPGDRPHLFYHLLVYRRRKGEAKGFTLSLIHI